MKGWFGGVLAWLGMVGLWWCLSLPFDPWPRDACRLVLGPGSGSLSIFSLRSLPTTSPQPTRDRAGGGESLAIYSPHPEPYALSMAVDMGPPWLGLSRAPEACGRPEANGNTAQRQLPKRGKEHTCSTNSRRQNGPTEKWGFCNT